MKEMLKEPLADVVGQEKVKEQIRSALLMKRNVVIYGPPGIGKTTLAKNIAKLLPKITVNECGFNCFPEKPICPACRNKVQKTKTVSGRERFVRVQGSPDLCVEDLLGDIDPVKAIRFGASSPEAFTPGKIFRANNGVLFFDELNRCPEKLQNSLLQVLEEKKATLGSYDIDINADFLFIATMNPHDSNTEKLSDVLLDRFDVIYMGYPETTMHEYEILKSNAMNLANCPKKITDIIISFIRYLRQDKNLEKLPSVRATTGLYERSQANAILRNRKNVIFQDVLDSVVSVVSHRIRLKPSMRFLHEPDTYVSESFDKFVDMHPDIDKGGAG